MSVPQPCNKSVILYSDPSLDIAFRLLFLLVSKMQHFLSFHLCCYKSYSACVYFRASLLQYPLFLLCPICTEDIYLPSPHMGCASLYLLLPACSLLCHIYPNMLSFVSQAIAVCIPFLPSQIPKACPALAQHTLELSSVVSAHGSWHQHLPLALEIQATLVIPRCFKHVNSCCCYS